MKSGNVDEWCGNVSPQGSFKKSQRVLKGGGYSDDSSFCKVSSRKLRDKNEKVGGLRLWLSGQLNSRVTNMLLYY